MQLLRQLEFVKLEAKINFTHFPRTLLQEAEKLTEDVAEYCEVCGSVIVEQTPFLRQPCLSRGVVGYYK